MKKKLFITMLTIVALTLSTQAQILKKGNTIIDGYYGFPNMYGTSIKTSYANSNTAFDVDPGMIGPLGGKIEYLLSDKVGLGLNGWYSNAWVKWTEDQQVLVAGSTTQYETKTYNYKVEAPRTDVLVMFNYHFVNTESVDSYFCVGAGYHNRTFRYVTDDPNFNDDGFEIPIPFNARVGIGMRYFFVENFGINIEFGLGGPLLHGGICAKF
ncbi:MAG: hypothetical protein V2A54_02795 [Bacteroidota bacterium]